MSPCASELALELHLIDPARSHIGSHLDACRTCKDRLEGMAREGEHFIRFVYPRTVDRVIDAGTHRRTALGRLAAWLVPAGGVAAAAAALLLVSPQPPSGYLGVKGTALSLQAWVGGAEGPRPVEDGERVSSSAHLRFRVAAGEPCRLWLVSVDARGGFSRLYPPDGDGPAVVRGRTTLPGGVALDGEAGPERLYAVCAADPLPLEVLERASRTAAAGGVDGLRQATRLPGLPEGAAQASLLVEKQP